MARTVLVTGGNRGIGLAIAQAFVEAGRPGRDHPPRHRRRRTACSACTCDITDPAAVDAAFTTVEAELGPVEVLVANAGITDDTLLMRMSEEQFSRVIDTNLTGAWRCAKRATTEDAAGPVGPDDLRLLGGRPDGGAGQVNYAASKAGLVGMARSITRELGSPQHHRERGRARLHRDRHDRRRCPTTCKASYLKQIPAGRMAARRTRSPPW